MASERRQQIERLFQAALEREPAHRIDFLDGISAIAPHLSKDVELLLRSHGADIFLEKPSTEVPPESVAPTASLKGGKDFAATREAGDEVIRQVGPYRILREIGRGGMGIVYEAEQEAPVRRKIALKLIKWGMDTEAVIARFQSERQALALMNHINIASVFDAGATEHGRPYFAMELVQGIPVTEYCDQHQLTVHERLALFIHICEGVQHAHQKGIIHRDIKPSNVLVAMQDGRAIPKIIDFGVSKATSQRLTEQTVYTELGELIGTPEYMSPEQAEITRFDIDTRTDVYSLGVLLYELLVGTQPFDPKELRSSGFDEFRRKIREVEPLKPSTRLTRLGDTAAAAAKNRRIELPLLTRQLRGDLDWITMKAMEKDRNRRYASPSELAADIERYLEHQPVLASPPGTAYRMGKFVRRHRFGVAAGATVVLALLLGISGTTFSLLRALEAEAEARREAERANREANAAEQVSDFLVDLFEVSDPGEARGASLTALEILERGADRVSEQLVDQPLTQARLQATIGRVYDKMGLFDEAAPYIEDALEIRRKLLSEEHVDVAQSLGALGDLYRKQGRYAEAEPLLKQALELREKLLGPDHPDVARSLNNLAVLYENAARYSEAEPLYQRAFAIQEKELGADHIDLAISLTNLAILMAKQGKYADSEPLFQRALTIEEKELGRDHPRVALANNNLAIACKLQGKYEEAEPLYRRALEIQEQVLGPKHPDVARSLQNLANLHLEQEHYQEAEPLYRRSLEISEEALGPDHPDVGRSLDNLAKLYALQGEYAEAERLYRRALEIREKALGPEHHELATNLHNLADLYRDQHRYEEAEPLYRRSLSICRKILDPEHPDLRVLIEDLAEFLRLTGRPAEASELEDEERRKK